MNPITATALLEEFEKLAYGLKEHKALAVETAKTFAPGAQKYISSGSLANDLGMRTAFFFATADLHALPGKKKKIVAQNIVAMRDRSLKDLAKTLAKGGSGTKHEAKLIRGLMDLGQSQHSWVDLVAHHEKPLAEGTALPTLRKVFQRTRLGGPVGVFLALGEHLKSNIKGAYVDSYAPRTNKMDRLAQTRAQNWGTASRKRLIDLLVKDHGLVADDAVKAIDSMFIKGMPGKAAQTLGTLSRNMNYLGRTFFGSKGRAVTSAAAVAAGVGAMVLADEKRRKKILGKFKSTVPLGHRVTPAEA